MKFLTISFCLLISTTTTFANSKHGHQKKESKEDRRKKYKHPDCVFDVTPLNSPVKETYAKFHLDLPHGFDVHKVRVKLKDARDIFDKKKPTFDDIELKNNNDLHVNVSKLPPGFYQLHVVVFDKKQKKEHIFKTKLHDYVRFVVDESMQVPEPDPNKNNATIAGIDSDNDGIRDDIQRYINATYANQPNVKLGLKQYAIAYQLQLTTTDNKQQSIQATNAGFKATDCLRSQIDTQASVLRDQIQSKYLNTKERLLAEKKADLNFHGQGGTIPDDLLSQCEFEVE